MKKTATSRTEQLSEIFKEFDDSANRFCEKTGGVRCEIDALYSGEETAQNLKYRYARIYYNTFAIGFRYTAHAAMSIVNSILECLIFTDRSDEAVGIPLSFITDSFGISISTPLTVPLISSGKAMKEAFSFLGGTVCDLIEQLEELCLDSYKCEKLCSEFVSELLGIYGIKDDIEEAIITESDYDFLTLRSTSDAYINYLKGNTKKAVKQLEKVKDPTKYERRLLDLWKNGSEIPEGILPTVRKNASAYNDSGVQTSGGREFVALFISWILFTPFISVLYVGLYYFLMQLEGRDSIYLMGPLTNLPLCFTLAFLTSIPVSYFTRRITYKILFKKDFARFCELDSIQNGSGADRTIKVLLHIIVIGCIVICILLTKWNVNFKEDGFVDNSKFFSLKSTYYSYSDIEKIKYRPTFTNAFGDEIDIPSYIIVLKSGKEIDLYELDDVESYEDILIGYLKSRGVRIEDK